MRKILFYIDSMQKGGANRVMANLVDYFAMNNYKVILVNDISSDNLHPEYEINNSAKRLILNETNSNVIFSNLKRIKKLRSIICTERPDCVLSFMGPPNIRMLLATIFCSCRKVISVRNDPKIEYGNNLFKKIAVNCLFSLADGCVFQTYEASDYFYKSIKRKSTVILNPINNKFYDVSRGLKTHNIVSVGRLFPQKNHELLINAFSCLADDYPDENLVIYGEGSLRDDLEMQINSLGLKNRVFLPGNVEDVHNVLKNAKLFVLSSDFEGMPNALMEAMACGVPVISTDCPCGGPKMLLGNDEYGMLVPCNDKQKMVNAIRIILDKAHLLEFGCKAKLRAEIFKPDIVYKQWEDYLFLKLFDGVKEW